jgi:hypothetical protein
MRIKDKEQYKARIARRGQKRARKTRNSDEWDRSNGMYEVYGSPFNSPPMDLIGSDKTRFVNIDDIFGHNGIGHGQNVGTPVPVYYTEDPQTGKPVPTFTTEPGKKYRIRWDPAQKRDVLTEN